MRCSICGSRQDIQYLNTKNCQGQALCDTLGIKADDHFTVNVCKLCLASHTLTGEWPLMCVVCKKGFAKAPMPCDSCGGLTCEDCATRQLPPGTWEIKFNVPNAAAGGRLRLCKNCVAEKALTED